MKKTMRQLRGHWRGARARWLSLTSFQRVAAGLAIAILTIAVVRTQALDRMQKELDEIEKELADKGAPTPIPAFEEDNEIQESKMTIENIERTLERVLKDEARVVAETRPLKSGQKNEAVALMSSAIYKAGLRLVESEEETPAADTPLPVSEHRFAAAGNFSEIYAFLRLASDYPYPCRIHDLAIVLTENSDQAAMGASPALTLKFKLRLFYYDGDA